MNSLRWILSVALLAPVTVFATVPDRPDPRVQINGDWPGWRGPRRDGVSEDPNVPLHWSPTRNIRWKTPIPGTGHSSPVITGDRVFLTTCLEDQEQRLLLCLDRHDGHVLWQKEVLRAPLEKKNRLNSYASSTPVTDGRHVWVSFFQNPSIVITCYDLDGNEIWRKTPGEFHSIHGFCTSLLLDGQKLIANCDQDAPAYIVALDKDTGHEIWRADRPNRTRSYVPPLIVEAAGKRQLILSGSKCVASYDVETGKQIWIVDGPTEQFVAAPAYLDGIVCITAGFPEHWIVGIRPDGCGNVTSTHVAWRDTRGAGYVPSPVAWGHWFFVASDNGMVSCLEAKTGRRMWEQRLGKHQSASAVAAAGHIYFTDDSGTTWVFKASDKYEPVAKNDINEDVRASPAISQGEIFIRTVQHLYCIGDAVK